MFWILYSLLPLLLFITFYTFQKSSNLYLSLGCHYISINAEPFSHHFDQCYCPFPCAQLLKFTSKTSISINYITIIPQTFTYLYPSDFQFSPFAEEGEDNKMWDLWRKPNYNVDALQTSTSLKAPQHTSNPSISWMHQNIFLIILKTALIYMTFTNEFKGKGLWILFLNSFALHQKQFHKERSY